MKFGMGQAVPRIEDPRLLRGGGRYTDDISLPGQARAVVVRSPHAHARITSIDTEAAKAWYNSPEYQEIVGMRLENTDGFSVLAQSFNVG